MEPRRQPSRVPLPQSFPPPLARCHRAPSPPPNTSSSKARGSMQKRPRPPDDGSHEDSRKTPRPVMPPTRISAKPSPRTVEETIGFYLPAVPMDKDLCGAPRLSAVALASSRLALARGRIRDLSAVADEHGFSLLSGHGIGPDILRKLEVLNPSRVGLFEAAWARLVREKFGVSELPSKCRWWREFYEDQIQEEEMRLKRAGEKLRKMYSVEEERQGRKMEMTKRIRIGERKRKVGGGVGGGTSRLARLREEVRREIRKR